MGSLRSVAVLVVVAVTLAAGAGRAAAHDPVWELDAQARAVAAALDPRVAAALARIDGTGRRLLALRSYLRSAAHLRERWSWSDAQIRAYEGSPEHRELAAEIDRVRRAFARANPGYQLWVNPQARSLDLQVERWNSNATVAAAAGTMLQDALRHFGRPSAKLRVRSAAGEPTTALEQFLLQYRPRPAPSLAAPGLSLHGQLRAVDFQVLTEAGRLVAGTDVDAIENDWDAQGWAARLEQAVRAAGCRFTGPLEHPREPWHYTYEAQVVTSRDARPSREVGRQPGRARLCDAREVDVH